MTDILLNDIIHLIFDTIDIDDDVIISVSLFTFRMIN